LTEALTACYAARQTCGGIASNWYAGAPYLLHTRPATLSKDESSYGCAITLVCD
jgi:hypothetical protein